MKPKVHLIENIFSSSFIFHLTFGIIIPSLVNTENSWGLTEIFTQQVFKKKRIELKQKEGLFHTNKIIKL